MKEQIKQQLKEKFGDIVKFDEPLSNHTSYKIGGNAEVFVTPEKSDELIEVLRYLAENGLQYFILGGGSNVLIPDEGIKGVVINPSNKDIEIIDQTVKAGAGAVLSGVAAMTTKEGLTGLEWGIGVPGNIGGAVRGNVGCFGREIKDSLIEAAVFDGKEVKVLSNNDLDFSYRTSRIKKSQGKEIVIDATFRLEPADPKECMARMKEYMNKKSASQPMGELTAGCVFKNVQVDPQTKKLRPPSTGEPTQKFYDDVEAEHPEFFETGIVPTAWMIDKLGLKGYEKDGIKISEKHANFLVNTGEGTEKAIKDMVEYIKGKVKEEYGVNLDEEVEFV